MREGWGEEAQAAFVELEREMGGSLHGAIREVQTGACVTYKADIPVKTASVIKLPILVHVALAVREGTLDWNTPLTLTDAEKVGGSGVLTQLTAGLTLSLRDACTLMTIVSDNTGTNMVIEHVGVEPINARMREYGLPVTTLFRKAYSPDLPDSLSQRYGLGMTTAQEMCDLMTLLAEEEIGDAETSAGILQILTEQRYRDSIPRLLPNDWKYAGKTGGVDGVRNDVGLVTAPDGRRFALALFCQELPDLRWTADNLGLVTIARLARLLVGA